MKPPYSSMVERSAHNACDAGSIPAAATNQKIFISRHAKRRLRERFQERPWWSEHNEDLIWGTVEVQLETRNNPTLVLYENRMLFNIKVAVRHKHTCKVITVPVITNSDRNEIITVLSIDMALDLINGKVRYEWVKNPATGLYQKRKIRKGQK